MLDRNHDQKDGVQQGAIDASYALPTVKALRANSEFRLACSVSVELSMKGSISLDGEGEVEVRVLQVVSRQYSHVPRY
jgi:hypothetical protein